MSEIQDSENHESHGKGKKRKLSGPEREAAIASRITALSQKLESLRKGKAKSDRRIRDRCLTLIGTMQVTRWKKTIGNPQHGGYSKSLDGMRDVVAENLEGADMDWLLAHLHVILPPPGEPPVKSLERASVAPARQE